jgi:molybdopterin synthase catalytic subunit
MRVRVLFFGRLKEIAGCTEDCRDLPEGARVEDLFAGYAASFPALRDYRPLLAAAVNEELAAWDCQLRGGDVVAFLPPVSGGAPEAQVSAAHDLLKLVRAPIPAAEVIAHVKSPHDGAVAVFDGTVRNHSRGRQTLYLEYEAYEPMALRTLREIAAQMHALFKIDRVALVHRLGRLEIGETSVLIAVSAAHRSAAFDACRWAIETLKRAAPIWKKEYFAGGAVWVEGAPAGPVGRAANQPFSCPGESNPAETQ